MNEKIRLDSRLSTIKSLVRPCELAADVGCDHGYLICELVKSGIAKRGLACEANPAPLDRARNTITKYCLSHSIDTVLTNGLTGLPFASIDVFIIAGMGGDLISEILLACPQTRDERFEFVLQPMTKPEKLREAILKNGFTIASENTVICDNKVYTVMLVKYTKITCTYDMITFHTGLLHKNNDFSSRLFLSNAAQRLDKKSNGLKMAKKEKKAEEYAYIARQIRERAGL